jgi:hypothetical protein
MHRDLAELSPADVGDVDDRLTPEDVTPTVR